MSAGSLYRCEGDRYVPTEICASPWSPDQQHGGPVLGLLAYAAESHVSNPDFRPVRLSADLFRAVPLSPLQLRPTTIRQGRRIKVVQVSLFGEGQEVSRAHVLFLRGSSAPEFETHNERVAGPEGFPTTSMIPKKLWKHLHPGFHTHVEVRWVNAPGSADPTFWARVPANLIDNNPWTPFQRAASISDLANAIASVHRMAHVSSDGSFINPDCTMYLSRLPEGEWIRVRCDHLRDSDAVGVGEVVHHDECGRFARTLQARLANEHPLVPREG